jgi:hypothetical protein
MRLSAPTNIVFIISVILLVVGLLIHLGVITALAPYGFWITFAGGALLALGALLKGL